MSRARCAALTFFAVSFVASCAPARVHLEIDSFSDPSAYLGKYILLPGIAGVTPENLQFREFAEFTHRALQRRGFVRARKPRDADIAIFLGYGIGEPQTISYSFPMYGMTGGGKTTFTTDSYGSGGGHVRTTGEVESERKWGVVGEGTETSTHYFAWATVDAVDIRETLRTKHAVPAWETRISTFGSRGDLRVIFPIMIGGSAKYFGVSTGKQVKRWVSADSPDVKAIRVRSH